MKIALYQSQREIHTARAAPRGISLKSHPTDYHQKLTNRGRRCLIRLYQAADHISMPITTDIDLKKLFLIF